MARAAGSVPHSPAFLTIRRRWLTVRVCPTQLMAVPASWYVSRLEPHDRSALVIERSPSVIAAGRSLWARESADADGGPPAAARICSRVGDGLARWIGRDGYRALFRRARDEELPSHPALAGLDCDSTDAERVAAAVAAHGADAVSTAVVALVTAVIVLLGRVVGEEMAIRLVEQAAAGRPAGDSANAQNGVLDE